MLSLNNEDYELNREGILAPSQVKRFKMRGYFNIGMSVVFFALCPLTVLGMSTKLGISIVFLVCCLGAGALFWWMSKEDMKVARCTGNNCVKCAGGILEVKNRGKKTNLKIAGKTFVMDTYMIRKLKNGARYEVFYSGELKKVVGWKEMV